MVSSRSAWARSAIPAANETIGVRINGAAYTNSAHQKVARISALHEADAAVDQASHKVISRFGFPLTSRQRETHRNPTVVTRGA